MLWWVWCWGVYCVLFPSLTGLLKQQLEFWLMVQGAHSVMVGMAWWQTMRHHTWQVAGHPGLQRTENLTGTGPTYKSQALPPSGPNWEEIYISKKVYNVPKQWHGPSIKITSDGGTLYNHPKHHIWSESFTQLLKDLQTSCILFHAGSGGTAGHSYIIISSNTALGPGWAMLQSIPSNTTQGPGWALLHSISLNTALWPGWALLCSISLNTALWPGWALLHSISSNTVYQKTDAAFLSRDDLLKFTQAFHRKVSYVFVQFLASTLHVSEKF